MDKIENEVLTTQPQELQSQSESFEERYLFVRLS